MKVKTFILTFLMMTCPFLFGHISDGITLGGDLGASTPNGVSNTSTETVVLFSDDFNDGNLLDGGWRLINADGDGYNWAIENGYIFSKSYYSGVTVEPDDYIVTENAYKISESSALTFKSAPTSSYQDNKYRVVVSENGEDWNEVFTENLNDRKFTTMLDITVDLGKTAYVGKTVYIGFNHYYGHKDYGSGVKIDDVVLTGVPSTEEDPAYGKVAKVGDVYYETLADAYNAATDGKTITLLDNITLSEIFVIAKSITLDGKGMTLTSSAGRAINVSGADGVTIKDLTINASGERAINVIQNATNVTIDGVTATAANYTVNVAASAPNAVVAINNSTLNGLCTVNVAAAGAYVTIDNSTVNCNDNNTTVGEAYAALSLNKDAVGASIVATNTTVNVTDGSDSMKGRNSAENGTVSINGSTDDVTVMVAVITYEGSTNYYSFETLAAAVEYAKAGDVVTLIRDITASDIITINKAITLDLNGKKVTSTAKKAFEVYADATIKNGAIEAAQRCVDTRTAVVLTLTDVELVAKSTTYGNPQPLTIGGSDNGTEVTMENVEINAGTAGYGIITFVETKLTATESAISGYSALYVKPGSDNSEFNFVNSDLSGGNIGNDVEGNSFSTIAVRANNVAVNVDAESTVTANGGHYYAISFIGKSENTTTGSSVTVAGEITGNILDTPNGNTVKVKPEYADELAAAGYATIEAENGLVAVIKPVAQVGETYYATLQDAFNAATEGQTVTVINDVELESTVTVAAGKVVTLDLNGKTINTAWADETAEKHYYAFINEGTLTITDKSAEANGVINARGNYNDGILTLDKGTINAIDHNGGYGVQNRVGSKFTMKGGLIATTNENGDAPGKGYDATTVRVDNGAEFIMNGGEINNISNFTIAIENYGTTTINENAGEVKSVHTTVANHGTMTIYGGTFICDGLEGVTAHALWATVGKTTINGGTFNGKDNYNGFNVDAEEGAVVEINGGNFESVHSGSLYGKGTITVKGGTFFDNVSERCADGYAALPNLDGNFIVGTKPTATVNNLGSVTIPAGEYSIWNGSFDQNTEDDGDMPLSFVMQFLADQDAEDMATSPFANWYGDFVITFTGIENDSFTADGCYLAGHYGEFGWVKIPVDGMEIERDARYPVMLGVGLGQKYDYICSGVEDFKCALYLTPEILAANPNIQVNLELAIVDNSKGSDAAASALVNNTNVYEVVDYDYDAIDFNMNYVARIGEIGYNTLEEALEAVTEGQTIVLLQNIDLTESLTVVANQTVILDLNGKKINYNSTNQGEAMITNRGNLTINDSGNTGEIYYNYTGAADPTYGKGNYTISNVGTLTVNGGKIHIADLRAHAKYPIDNNSTSGDAILVINGGHLYNYNTSAIRQFCNSTTNKNSVTINGGLIEGYSAIWMQNPGTKTVNGQLAINAGEIRTTAKAYVNGTSSISEVASKIYCTIDGEGGAWDESSAVAIDGGIINENVCLNNETPASVTLNKEATYNGSIKLYDGGQFVHNGLKNVTLSKDITGHPVPENNSEYVDGWYTISSPVGTVNHTDVVGLLNGTHDLYRYDEPTMKWENVKVDDNNFTTLDLGRGYIYANTANTTLSFTGDLVVGAVEQYITATDNNLKGFNLIGNPFTHNIRKANLSGVTLAEGYYTLSNHGAWQAVNEGDVAPMQGVLVQATTAGNLTINPTPQRSERINNGSIVINVANAKYSDVAYVTFNDGVGLNKIAHRNAEVPMVYVPVNGENFAIATMSQDVNEIPVSFKASTMGQYTISVKAIDCEFENMYLTDRMTGEKVNLLLEDYTFVATSNDNANRFVISFATTMPESVAENFIYINNGNMIINNIEGNAVVRVLDVLGRPVAEYNVTESANISTATLSSGVYMIQMYDNNGVKVQKVVVE